MTCPHGTYSEWCGYCIWALIRDPEFQAKVRAEPCAIENIPLATEHVC